MKLNSKPLLKGENQKNKRVPKRKRPIQKLKKKRYLQKRDRLRNDSDLRSHLNKQSEELKELKAQLDKAKTSGPVRPPASNESIEAWSNKYPEIASIVETIANQKAEEKLKNADARLQEIDKLTAQAQRSKSEDEIRSMHSDFDDLRSSDEFHNWAEEQPKWVQDALYENQDDPKSVIRVIDLYKIDNNMDVKGKQRSTKQAASEVKTRRTTKPENNDLSGSIRESAVQKMSAQQYEANSDSIMEAIRSGKFIYDISGGAR